METRASKHIHKSFLETPWTSWQSCVIINLIATALLQYKRLTRTMQLCKIRAWGLSFSLCYFILFCSCKIIIKKRTPMKPRKQPLELFIIALLFVEESSSVYKIIIKHPTWISMGYNSSPDVAASLRENKRNVFLNQSEWTMLMGLAVTKSGLPAPAPCMISALRAD